MGPAVLWRAAAASAQVARPTLSNGSLPPTSARAADPKGPRRGELVTPRHPQPEQIFRLLLKISVGVAHSRSLDSYFCNALLSAAGPIILPKDATVWSTDEEAAVRWPPSLGDMWHAKRAPQALHRRSKNTPLDAVIHIRSGPARTLARLPKITHPRYLHLRYSQRSTTPQCNGAASPWGNRLGDHG